MATVKKKATRTSPRTSPRTAHRKAAADNRNTLVKQLRQDLRDAKDTLKAATASAKAEMAVLKDELKAALIRERELVKLGEKKISMMVSAGEKWERQQVAKIRKIVAKRRRS